MSRLEKLIAELCPDGVEYKKLGDVATITRGGNFQKKDYVESGVPCIHYGQIYVHYGLFVDETISFISEEKAKKQKFAEPNDVIMAVTSENIDDVCKCIAWLGLEKVAVSGHAAIIHHNLNPKYLVYYLRSAMFYQQKTKLAHGTKVIEVTPNKLNDIVLPVPPLEIQKEIVRILDSFTELTAELQAELQARKKQYEYYRDELFTVTEYNLKDYCKIGDFSRVLRGKRLTKDQLSNANKYPVYHGGLEPLGFYKESNRNGDTVMIINVGASAGTVGYSKEEFWSSDGCYCLEKTDKVNNKYLYYALQSQEHYIKSRVRVAGIPTLDAKVIENLEILLPSVDLQNRIVNVLDNFDAICSDLKIGLPAEIEARQKQYEYYRDLLLSFNDNSQIVNVERERDGRQGSPERMK